MKTLKKAGIRCEMDERDEKIGFKIREAQLEKVPYMLILGQNEEEEKVISVRMRDTGETTTMPLQNFLDLIADQMKEAEV